MLYVEGVKRQIVPDRAFCNKNVQNPKLMGEPAHSKIRDCPIAVPGARPQGPVGLEKCQQPICFLAA